MARPSPRSHIYENGDTSAEPQVVASWFHALVLTCLMVAARACGACSSTYYKLQSSGTVLERSIRAWAAGAAFLLIKSHP